MTPPSSFYSRWANSTNPNAGSSSSGKPNLLTNDSELTQGPDDTTQHLAFSPVANHLAVASWDCKVRIYDVSKNKTGDGIAWIEMEKPAMSCAWSLDGTKVVGAGADKTAQLLDLNSNGAPAYQVAAHDDTIRCVKFINAPNSNGPMIATGSWDQTVKYWDLRQPMPAGELKCQERVWAMDSKSQYLAIATANRCFNYVDLANPFVFKHVIESPLPYETRDISLDAKGDCLGAASYGGRCVFYNNLTKEKFDHYTFRCHRRQRENSKDDLDIYPVNAVEYHPKNEGTVVTAGSEGIMNTWCIKTKTRLSTLGPAAGSITAAAWNFAGDKLAYAVGYDWHAGHTGNKTDLKNLIFVHDCLKGEYVKGG